MSYTKRNTRSSHWSAERERERERERDNLHSIHAQLTSCCFGFPPSLASGHKLLLLSCTQHPVHLPHRLQLNCSTVGGRRREREEGHTVQGYSVKSFFPFALSCAPLTWKVSTVNCSTANTLDVDAPRPASEGERTQTAAAVVRVRDGLN